MDGAAVCRIAQGIGSKIGAMGRWFICEKEVRSVSEKREQTTLRVPEELLEWLKEEAERRGVSLNAMLLMILNEARKTECR